MSSPRSATCRTTPRPATCGADLVAELLTFRDAMVERRLDRSLAVLVDLVEMTASDPAMGEVRDRLVADGERVVRQLLATVVSGTALEAAALMLCGAVLQSALLHGQPPEDDQLVAVVDLALDGLP